MKSTCSERIRVGLMTSRTAQPAIDAPDDPSFQLAATGVDPTTTGTVFSGVETPSLRTKLKVTLPGPLATMVPATLRSAGHEPVWLGAVAETVVTSIGPAGAEPAAAAAEASVVDAGATADGAA
ncbi:MAG: hypothetical protein ACRDV9_03255 [Acidimicrobiia bacterium]